VCFIICKCHYIMNKLNRDWLITIEKKKLELVNRPIPFKAFMCGVIAALIVGMVVMLPFLYFFPEWFGIDPNRVLTW